MAYSVVGNTVFEGKRELETCGSHTEAVKAAEDRNSPGPMAIDRTRNSVITFGLDGAVTYTDGEQEFRAIVSPDGHGDGGKNYPAGSYVLLDKNDQSVSHTASEFVELGLEKVEG